MLPWGHLGVAYLAYTLVVRTLTGEPPRAWPAVALAVGSQLPDLIDKPLAWELGVLPAGRSLGHSLLFIGLVALAVRALIDAASVTTWAAFVFGQLAHTLTDAAPLVLDGSFAELGYLLWPVTPLAPVPGELQRDILTHILTTDVSPMRYVGLVAFLLAAMVWWRDGTPGIPQRSWRHDRAPE